MAIRHDISGSWRGYYEQGGGRHGISMQVEHRGVAFVGRMRDQDTVLSGSMPLGEIVAEQHVDAADEVEDICAEDAAIEIETLGVLPEFSIVEGTVEHDAVRFDKRYQGAHEVSAWAEDTEVHIRIPEHRVRYEGHLGPDGASIRGRWVIAASEELEGASGGFVLHRQPRS